MLPAACGNAGLCRHGPGRPERCRRCLAATVVVCAAQPLAGEGLYLARGEGRVLQGLARSVGRGDCDVRTGRRGLGTGSRAGFASGIVARGVQPNPNPMADECSRRVIGARTRLLCCGVWAASRRCGGPRPAGGGWLAVLGARRHRPRRGRVREMCAGGCGEHLLPATMRLTRILLVTALAARFCGRRLLAPRAAGRLLLAGRGSLCRRLAARA